MAQVGHTLRGNGRSKKSEKFLENRVCLNPGTFKEFWDTILVLVSVSFEKSWRI